ncbi:integrator complex subunit 11-like [Strongylocentrotus purpuratus]|nr:integrator complex subunit 11-like [Strongylocentrotus purpuratus]
MQQLGLVEHDIRFTSTVSTSASSMEALTKKLKRRFPQESVQLMPDASIMMGAILLKMSAESDDNLDLLVSWPYQEEELGSSLLSMLQSPKTSQAE